MKTKSPCGNMFLAFARYFHHSIYIEMKYAILQITNFFKLLIPDQ